MRTGRPRVPLRERLLARIEVQPDGCWVWTGYKDERGYGRIAKGGAQSKCLMVHRVAYELFVGPIADALTIDHLCRNPSCVNPEHLEPVTIRENILRSDGFAAQNSRKTRCPKGHRYDGVNAQGRRICTRCQRDTQRRHYERKVAA